jgi:poly-gamma-glutamate capsule biosynthesis protein CapA/YwtB (metallophosphatase superfamily)
MNPRPSREFREFARRVIGAGADVFWGHSAHVVQGIELMDGSPILYDTGDFVDDYAVDPDLRNDQSALFVLQVGLHRVERLEVLPVTISDRQVRLARGSDRDGFVQRFSALCVEMGTTVVPEPGELPLSVVLERRGARAMRT